MANLARRLRSLRTGTWPSLHVTQLQLAAALDVSPALISSWESAKSSAVPPTHRLEAYARFFATARSVDAQPYRLLEIDELTDEENADREALLEELLALTAPETTRHPTRDSPFDGTTFQYPVDEDITIVCSELPVDRRSRLSYSDPASPDHIEAYKYADLDALLELHGHVRAANPTSQVRIRVGSEMGPDDYATHLVLLGGVDWNPVTREVLALLEVPVDQLGREDDAAPGRFEVDAAGRHKPVSPVLQEQGSSPVLKEDVAQFCRSVSPFNAERTVTICNGMHQPGTLGVVRALTDKKFRNRNEEFLRDRFSGVTPFSIISRVRVTNSRVITPDWSRPDDRLHEWPPRADG